MRLTSLWVKEYGVLRDLTITFRQGQQDRRGYEIDILVGRNGSGKSTLLRLLAEIFVQLENTEGPQDELPFEFEISYVKDQPPGPQTEAEAATQNIITIRRRIHRDEDDNDDARADTEQTGIAAEGTGQEVSEQADAGQANTEPKEQPLLIEIKQEDQPFRPFMDRPLLPEQIVVLTSGGEREWERIAGLYRKSGQTAPSLNSALAADQVAGEVVRRPGRRAESPDDTLTQDQTSSRQSEAVTHRLTFIRTSQLPLVFLCAMLDRHRQGETSQRFKGLNDALTESGIGRMTGFSLRVRIDNPLDDDPLSTASGTPSARGAILERLRTARGRERALGQERALCQGSERLLVYDLAALPKDKVLGYPDGWELLRALAPLCAETDPTRNMLQGINIFLERGVRRRGDKLRSAVSNPPLLMFSWMSDGEQSFLGRLALLALLQGQDALILLDEPEVHFNDYWKRQLVAIIDNTLSASEEDALASDTAEARVASHVVLTTHSSITLTDVARDDIVKLERRGAYTSGSPPVLAIHTLAADPSDIMVHVFDTEYAAGAFAISYVEELAKQIRRETPEELKDLERRSKNIAPGYWRYLLERTLSQKKKQG